MRSNVFIDAGNDYRDTSIGGRRQSNSGWSNIQFDWFKKEEVEVPDKRYKKQEVMRTVENCVASGTDRLYSKVRRECDGSVSASVTFPVPPKNTPEGVFSCMVDLSDKLVLEYDPVKLTDEKANKIREYFNKVMGEG